MKRSFALISTVIALIAAFAFTSCASTAQTTNLPADQASSKKDIKEGVAGGTIVNTVTKTVVVVAIDKKERTATLMGADKKQFTVKAGPEAVNFDKINKGDHVAVTYTEEMVIAVGDKAAGKDSMGEEVKITPKGGQPGGVATVVKQITATVVAIDAKNHTATLKFADGSTKVAPVRPDVDLSKYKKGDKVVFRVTQSVAIDIVKK